MSKYEQLKEQIKLEYEWGDEDYKKECNRVNNKSELDFLNGMLFAYRSILSKIEFLEREEV